jgi:hypothetical protein
MTCFSPPLTPAQPMDKDVCPIHSAVMRDVTRLRFQKLDDLAHKITALSREVVQRCGPSPALTALAARADGVIKVRPPDTHTGWPHIGGYDRHHHHHECPRSRPSAGRWCSGADPAPPSPPSPHVLIASSR